MRQSYNVPVICGEFRTWTLWVTGSS